MVESEEGGSRPLTYLTDRVDVSWSCEVCGASSQIQYEWPMAIIIEEGELRLIANRHHAERSPECAGFLDYHATKAGNPLPEFHLTPFQKIRVFMWVLFPFLVAAVTVAIMWMLVRG